MPTPTREVPSKPPSTSQIIWDAITDLYAQHQVVSRETVCQVTGLKMTVVDDHVSRMIDDGKVHRVRAGVFVPVVVAPEPRPISVTDMPDGMTIVEMGDEVWKLWPKEVRVLATRLAGNAIQLSNIQAAHEAGETAAELRQRLKLLDRDVRCLRVAVLEPKPTGDVAARQPTPAAIDREADHA